jgi:alcohol dehydrogenase (cytochrome c)
VSAFAADVTPERLLNAASEPQNWLMVDQEYSSHRYSRLDEISTANAEDLHVAYTVALGGIQGGGRILWGQLEGTPLVNDGQIYAIDGWGTVYKIDATQGFGLINWIMDPGVDKADVWIAAQRGLALYKDFVISPTGDGNINWTKADTGELVQTVQVDDPANGYALTAAPLVIGDRLIVPGSGGDRGARSHIDAISADTGEAIWRWYSVPAPGEPGSETWKDENNAWMHGGGAFWQTGSYDPESNLTFWGTGQPVPMYDPEYRPGDNLFTDSTVAINVDTGELAWYFQYTPNDFLDYDEIGTMLLIDTTIDGEPRKLVSHFARNGFYYDLDRTNGQFIHAGQYANKVNWTAGIDPKTGKPVEYDPTKDLQTYAIGAPSRREQGQIIGCPNIQGGVNYFPTSYSERTRLAYGGGIEGCSEVTTDPSRSGGGLPQSRLDAEGNIVQEPPAPAFPGALPPAPVWNGGFSFNAERVLGSMTSVDPTTGQKVAQHMFDYTIYSGTLTTAGGLVFTVTADGTVFALDDMTLEPVWQFRTGATAKAPPMSFAVNGKQYVGVLIGGGSGALTNKSPELRYLQTTAMLYVFSL